MCTFIYINICVQSYEKSFIFHSFSTYFAIFASEFLMEFEKKENKNAL